MSQILVVEDESIIRLTLRKLLQRHHHDVTDVDNLDAPANWKELTTADVALMKGDGWYNNAGNGFVHRSPAVPEGQRRLFMSLDFTH